MGEGTVSTIRPFSELAEFRECVRLQREVWGYADEDLVPATHLLVSSHYGAVLLGAFDPDGALEGFVYSFPGRRDGEWVQYSRMLGVRAGRRNHGLGARLKAAQARASLAAGFRRMHWTFDPLERLNSHFNLEKLGVEVRVYHANLYGESSSALHRGLATDRFLAEWDLERAERAGRLAALLGESGPAGGGGAGEGATGATDATGAGSGEEIALSGTHAGGPGSPDLDLRAHTLLVEIPWDIQGLKRADLDAARAWRLATREALEHYLGSGYAAVGFRTLSEEGRAFHLLRRAGARGGTRDAGTRTKGPDAGGAGP
jgi:predicted GNAT superfamily acetyltransferase